jgi:predicted RNase H-like HicB family nuclease
MQFTIKLEESDEGGYTAQCLELPAAISEGDTKEDALENIREAIQLVLEVTQEQARSYTYKEVFKVEVACA